jgi:hypothetical protein
MFIYVNNEIIDHEFIGNIYCTHSAMMNPRNFMIVYCLKNCRELHEYFDSDEVGRDKKFEKLQKIFKVASI